MLANTFDAFVGADVARRFGLPAVWAIHESWLPQAYWANLYPPGLLDPEVRRSAMSAFAATAAVVFEAEATRRLYLSVTHPGAAVVVPYGVDTGQLEKDGAAVDKSSARRELGLPEDTQLLLVMGTTEPRKAQLLVAEAFASISDQYPNTTLVFVGDTGTPYANALKDFANATDLGGRIRVVPVVPDTLPWYRAADILLCASDIESLPRSVLEAMACGVTIVATNVFGLPELLSDGETGFLFEPRSRSALIAALRRVLDLEPRSLEEVGLAGRRHVVANYDSSGYTTDILNILEGLIRDPTVSPGQFLGLRGTTT
jgi:glycosyltransferase involved in cell wall biosynthesis